MKLELNQMLEDKNSTVATAIEEWNKLTIELEYFYPKYAQKLGTLPTVQFDCTASNVAGLAWKDGTRVSYNLAYILTMSKEQFRETVAHELCHIAQFRIFPFAKQAHGTEFRALMQMLGFKGDTYHEFDTAKAKRIAKANKAVLDIF